MDEPLFRIMHPALLAVFGESGWRLITSMALPICIATAAALWSWQRNRWDVLITALAAGLVGEVVSSHILKPIFDVARPCSTEGLSQLLVCSPTLSMPSSHAVSIVAGLLPLGLAWQRARPALTIAGLLFIASRLALGMHWPSDLLVGALIGALIGGAGIALQNSVAAR